MRKLVSITAMLLIFFSTSFGGNRIINYDKDQGLSSNFITGSAQDLNGFVWVATQRGLDRFDGTRFRNYPFTDFDGKPESISITTDPKGNLFVLTSTDRILSYDYSNEQFVVKHILSQHILGREFHIAVGVNDICWVTVGKELIAVDIGKNHILTDAFLKENITSIRPVGKGTVILASGRELYKAELGKSPTRLFQVNHIPYESNIRSICIDNSTIWVGTQYEGLWKCDINSESIIQTEASKICRGVPVLGITEADGSLFVSTAGSGLFLFDSTGKKLMQHFSESNSDNRILDNSIKTITPISSHSIFVGYYRFGFSIIGLNNEEFYRLMYTPGDKDNISHNITGAIFEPEPGKIWFGTIRGISEWDKAKDKWKQYKYTNSESRSNNLVQSICRVGNEIWIGSSFMPILRINYHSKTPIGYVIPETYMVKSIASDGAKSALIETSSSPHNLIFYLVDGKSVSFPSSDITHAIWDTRNSRYVYSNSEGLFSIATDNSGSLKSKTIFRESGGVRTFLRMGSGIFVLGTKNGLVFLNEDGNIFKRITKTEGLTEGLIMSIIDDNHRNIWFTSEDGLFRVDNKYKIESFGGMDRQYQLSYNPNSCLKDSQGDIYFGSNEGIIWFNPDRIQKKTHNCKFRISDFFIGTERITPGSLNSPLGKPINECDNIKLSHNQNSFSFYLSDLSMDPYEKTNFEWTLKGWSSSWSSSIDEIASFTKIDYGNYTLIVRDAQTKKIYKVLGINILPPFWRSNVAIALYLFLLACIAIFCYIEIRNRYQRNYEKSILSFISSTVHDIKTPLSLIYSIIDELMEKVDKNSDSYSKLNLAKENARKIQKMTVDVLAARQTDSAGISVSNTVFNFSELINAKAMSYEILASRHNVKLVLDAPQNPILIFSDEKILDRILDNLLSNAVKYSKNTSDSLISIEVRQDKKKRLHIIIKDNGIGIPYKQQHNIFKPYFRADNARKSTSEGTGLGLMITKTYILTLGGTIQFISKENIGTTFELVLPLRLSKTSVEDYEAKRKSDEEETNKSGTNASHILVVDDNEEFTNYIAQRLTQKGYVCSKALNGKIALEKLHSQQFDMVITDNEMPLIKGTELVFKMKNDPQISHIPVIMLSGYSENEDIISGLSAGADSYLNKPINIELLYATITGLFENRHRIFEKLASGDYDKKEQLFQNNLNQEFIDSVTACIHKNIDNSEFGVIDLSKDLGYSRTALYNKIKSLLQIVPNELIRSIRLTESKRLLQDPGLNISDVAYKVGFSDPKYFGTCFHKQFGITPSEYITNLKSRK